jgi:hypothetical protein
MLLRTADPFAMLVDPVALFQEIEKSEPLKALHGRICRPLDRVATPKGPVTVGEDELDMQTGELEDIQ